MNIHYLQLDIEPFKAIVSGIKTIETRLYDNKRKIIRLGDTIIFINRKDNDQTIETKVIVLLRYNTFHDLFTHNDNVKFGSKNIDSLLNQISKFYSVDDQNKYGVIGIEFELISA